jgi:DNA repair exonuclease SbcCD nuclease subunit
MSKPYALASDIHAHNWSQFSSIGADGVNSRLRTTLNELLRAAEAIKALTDEPVLRIAGDLFHVRGKIEPSVFNPTFETFKKIAEMGVDVQIIPGNHDLEGVTADTLGNAMQQLDLIEGVEVFIEPTVCEDGTVMVPWVESLAELRKVCAPFANKDRDLIIHAPLNGVIRGLPDHGLDPVDVSKWGFHRVFCGHYHNHTSPQPSVYSIGATTHQNWCDPDTRAGFLIVTKDDVEYKPTQAPRFVNLDQTTTWTVPMVKGNFIRLRCQDIEEDALKAFRTELEKAGAAGIVDHSVKKRAAVRGVTAPKNLTLDVSVAQFVQNDLEVDDKLSRKKIALDALDVLKEAQMVGSD